VSRETTEAELRVFAGRSSQRSMRGGVLSLAPAAASALPERYRANDVSFAELLAGIVALVLLVGCTSPAGLLHAQMDKRRRELAARMALGALRRRWLRQLLTQIGLLVLIGSLCGLVVANFMLAALSSFELPGRLPIDDLDPHLNRWVLAFAMVAALLTGILSGIVPAWRAAFACDVASWLKTIGRTTARGRSRAQAATLALQVALTVVLLAGAGLFVRSVQAGLSVDFVFRSERLVSLDLNPRLRRYDRQRTTALVDQLCARLTGTPGVEAVTVGSTRSRHRRSAAPTLRADGQRRRIEPYRTSVPATNTRWCSRRLFQSSVWSAVQARAPRSPDTVAQSLFAWGLHV